MQGIWVLGRSSGMREPGVTGGAGRQCRRRGDRAPICVLSTFLSGFFGIAGVAPAGCHVDPAGEGLGEQTREQPGTCGSSLIRKSFSPLLLAHTRSSSSTLRLDSSTSRGKTVNDCTEGKKGLDCSLAPLLKAGALQESRVGKNPATRGVCSD